MAKDNDLPHQDFEGTRVDLGEDLVQDPADPALPLKDPETESDPIEELFANAKILLNEGLSEDAKKTLRKILILDPRFVAAKHLLQEIQDSELKQLLSEDQKVRRSFHETTHVKFDGSDAEKMIRKLDQDLQLGVFSEESSKIPVSQLSLFQNTGLMDDFCQSLEKDLSTAAVEDWVDLGIAFLEMDQFKVAVRLFAGAFRHLDPGLENYNEKAVPVISLLALALILSGRPFEAASKIQPFIRDIEIKRENKIELFYLMGVTYESMKKMDLAFQFFLQVKEIDPHYRDVEQKLRQGYRFLTK